MTRAQDALLSAASISPTGCQTSLKSIFSKRNNRGTLVARREFSIFVIMQHLNSKCNLRSSLDAFVTLLYFGIPLVSAVRNFSYKFKRALDEMGNTVDGVAYRVARRHTRFIYVETFDAIAASG